MRASLKESRRSLLTVLCDRCVLDGSRVEEPEQCAVCNGKRFYYWDPESYLCFSPDLDPLFVEDEKGDLIQIVRAPVRSSSEAMFLSLEDMLTYLGEWVALDRRRKFRVWYEEGWNCRVWPNGLRAGVISTRHHRLFNCVESCFKRVTSALA